MKNKTPPLAMYVSLDYKPQRSSYICLRPCGKWVAYRYRGVPSARLREQTTPRHVWSDLGKTTYLTKNTKLYLAYRRLDTLDQKPHYRLACGSTFLERGLTRNDVNLPRSRIKFFYSVGLEQLWKRNPLYERDMCLADGRLKALD